LQHVGSGELLGVRLKDSVRVSVAADGDVEMIRGAAAADHGVELLAL
jgi:hypothetical protein